MSELAALGQQGPSWDFLAHAQASPDAVAQIPALRFLVALNLAKLGLKELAAEQIAFLNAAGHPDVQALRQAIASLPAARLQPEAILAHAQRALTLLGSRVEWTANGAITAPGSLAMEQLAELLTRCEVYAARDANIVLRTPGDVEMARWSTLADINLVMREWTPKRDSGARPNTGFAFPVVVDGLMPPTVALRVWHATSEAYLGHTPRVHVLSANAGEHAMGLGIGLALDHAPGGGGFGSMLQDERVSHVVGPDASEHLHQRLIAGITLAMPSAVVTAPLTPTACKPLDAIQRARAEQMRLRERLTAELGAKYAGRSGQDWFDQLFPSDADSLARPGARVLIPTSRFTTYLQHASAGLAAALERAGLQAHVHIEPDAHSVFDGVARLAAINDADPDLVIRLNSPRMHGTDATSEPATRIPTVSWIQDAMPHLFDEGMGASMGPLDTLIGCRVPELVRVFKYPRERSQAMAVAADEMRFNPRVASGAAPRADLDCEIAYASHHSATPLSLHEKIASDSPPNVRPILERVFPHALRYAEDPFGLPMKQYLRGAARDALRECLGVEPDAAMVAKITNSYAMAIADRALRHRVLEWAANIAGRRGWRLRIYGNGWEAHPTLAAFARPALAHDAELAHSYARSTVHLHVSHHGPLHQRVFECALSGGLPAVLVTPAFVSSIWAWACSEPTDTGRRITLGEPIARSWACMAATACVQRLGMAHDAWYPSDGAAKHALAADHIPDTEAAARDLPLAISEAAYADAAGLERVVERAITSPIWRERASSAIATRVRERLTQDAFVRTMLTLVRRALHQARSPAAASVP